MTLSTVKSATSASWRRARLPWLWLGFLLIMAVAACAPAPQAGAGNSGAAVSKPLYQCPMHPEIVSDKPGDCPICGMRLVPIKSAPGPASAPAVPPPPGPSNSGEASPGSAHGGGSVPDEMNIGAEGARLAGVRTTEAEKGRVSQIIRATGTVAVDETRVRQVTTKVAGFVEKLYVNATGQIVHAGAPLFELYSPELLASQEEYIRARRSAGQFAKSVAA